MKKLLLTAIMLLSVGHMFGAEDDRKNNAKVTNETEYSILIEPTVGYHGSALAMPDLESLAPNNTMSLRLITKEGGNSAKAPAFALETPELSGQQSNIASIMGSIFRGRGGDLYEMTTTNARIKRNDQLSITGSKEEGFSLTILRDGKKRSYNYTHQS